MSETATMSTVSFLFRSLAGGLLVCICCAASKVATVVLAPSFFAVIMVAVASIICWWIARLFVSAASIVVANVATLPICGEYDNNFHFFRRGRCTQRFNDHGDSLFFPLDSLMVWRSMGHFLFAARMATVFIFPLGCCVHRCSNRVNNFFLFVPGRFLIHNMLSPM